MVKPNDPAKLSTDASADNQTSTSVGMHLDPSKQAKQAAAASRSRFGQTPIASGRYEPVAAPTHATTTNPDAQSRSGSTDAAASFLRRFEENATASGWTDDEAKRKFRLIVSRTVQDWYNQLRADERSTWKALWASFVREYILSPVPKQEVYYTMRQKENETIREYLFRFNAAATKIGLKYDTVRKHFVDHLRCFCNSLADPSQAKWISSMRFASMDDLKEYLNDQRHTEALREHRSQRGATQAGNNQRQERMKAPRVNHLDA
ncbi:unnamed protein product, partial [Aphanomyces euteiches]